MKCGPSGSLSHHAVSTALAVLLTLFHERAASAQIREPGEHPKYSVELEPHFLVQLTNREDFDNSDGIGLGARASIVILQNGPVPEVNNSLAIGVGFDWSHFDNDCGVNVTIPGIIVASGSCTANHFFFPIAAQWNFFFTPVVGAFTELGLAIQHWNEDVSFVVTGSRSGTTVAPVFAVGPRFILSDSFAIVARIGIPYLTIGASFLL